MSEMENAVFGKPKYRQCKNCGRSFKIGKGVNNKVKRFTPAGIVLAVCTLGTSLINPKFSFQKYCSRECWRADTQQ